MDVVPVPEDSRGQWKQDPFSGAIADGYIWGGGVLDDKNGDGPNSTTQNEARFRTRPEGRVDQRWLDTGRIPGTESYEILAIESVLNYGRFQVAGEFMNL